MKPITMNVPEGINSKNPGTKQGLTNKSVAESTSDILLSPEMSFIRSLALKHPEMRWLTGGVDASPENSVSANNNNLSIGKQIFPNLEDKDLIEFNRTAVGILCLYWAYSGEKEGYQKFTECQKSDHLKLTRESFDTLHKYTRLVLPEKSDFDALVIYTIINDLGKIHAIIEQIQFEGGKEFAIKNISHEQSIEALSDYAVSNNMKKIMEIVKMIQDEVGESNVDHDKVLLEGLEKHPKISPGFESLGQTERNKILTGLRGEFNMGQFLQGENLPASLSKLKGMDIESYDFYMAHFLFDLAGAAGQYVQNGSIVIDNPTFEGFSLGNEIIRNFIISENEDEAQVYRKFLEAKMSTFNKSIDTPQDYAIARLACMMRVKTIPDMDMLEKVYTRELGNNTRAILEKELGKNGINDGYATLFYYGPALIGNLQKQLGSEEGLKTGLITIARIAQEARISIKNRPGNGVHTIMMNEVAEIASKDPESLKNTTFEIQQVGEDAIVKPIKKNPINLDFITSENTINDLETQIPGKKIAIGGIGGGSDAVQALQVGKLLKESNKDIPFVFSVRTKTTSSQGPDGKSGQDRTPKNAIEVLPDIFEITPESHMDGRAMEGIISKEIKTYLILIDGEDNLSERIQTLTKLEGGIDTIIGVDTGGDALYSTGTDLDVAKSTPDQDLIVLDALSKIQDIPYVLTCEVAVGVDSPDNAGEVLQQAQAMVYTPTKQNIQDIVSYYQSIGMDGTSLTYFGKTPLAWQAALSEKTGVSEIPLPQSVVIDENNPWNPYIPLQECMKHIFFMKASNHQEAISQGKTNSLF